MKGLYNRISNVSFIIISGVLLLLITMLVIWFIGGIFVIVNEDKLYAKDLDNPYVDSDFKGWHVSETKYGKIMLPDDWKITENNEMIWIFDNEGLVATGGNIGASTSFKTYEDFMSQVIESVTSEVRLDSLHGLLGSSFGRVYINNDVQSSGYYLELPYTEANLFFYFSDTIKMESELLEIAEAIIYSHTYP